MIQLCPHDCSWQRCYEISFRSRGLWEDSDRWNKDTGALCGGYTIAAVPG